MKMETFSEDSQNSESGYSTEKGISDTSSSKFGDENEANKGMNELSSTSSINNYTWYSDGYKVKDTMKHSQQTLF